MTPDPTGNAPEARPPLPRGADFTLEESIHRFQNHLIDLMTGNLRTPPGDEDLRNARGS
jgi:hypothetical protein